MPKWDTELAGQCNECTLRAWYGGNTLYICEKPEGHDGSHCARDPEGTGDDLEWEGSEDGEQAFEKYWGELAEWSEGTLEEALEEVFEEIMQEGSETHETGMAQVRRQG